MSLNEQKIIIINVFAIVYIIISIIYSKFTNNFISTMLAYTVENIDCRTYSQIFFINKLCIRYWKKIVIINTCECDIKILRIRKTNTILLYHK